MSIAHEELVALPVLNIFAHVGWLFDDILAAHERAQRCAVHTTESRDLAEIGTAMCLDAKAATAFGVQTSQRLSADLAVQLQYVTRLRDALGVRLLALANQHSQAAQTVATSLALAMDGDDAVCTDCHDLIVAKSPHRDLWESVVNPCVVLSALFSPRQALPSNTLAIGDLLMCSGRYNELVGSAVVGLYSALTSMITQYVRADVALRIELMDYLQQDDAIIDTSNSATNPAYGTQQKRQHAHSMMTIQFHQQVLPSAYVQLERGIKRLLMTAGVACHDYAAALAPLCGRLGDSELYPSLDIRLWLASVGGDFQTAVSLLHQGASCLGCVVPKGGVLITVLEYAMAHPATSDNMVALLVDNLTMNEQVELPPDTWGAVFAYVLDNRLLTDARRQALVAHMCRHCNVRLRSMQPDVHATVLSALRRLYVDAQIGGSSDAVNDVHHYVAVLVCHGMPLAAAEILDGLPAGTVGEVGQQFRADVTAAVVSGVTARRTLITSLAVSLSLAKLVDAVADASDDMGAHAFHVTSSSVDDACSLFMMLAVQKRWDALTRLFTAVYKNKCHAVINWTETHSGARLSDYVMSSGHPQLCAMYNTLCSVADEVGGVCDEWLAILDPTDDYQLQLRDCVSADDAQKGGRTMLQHAVAAGNYYAVQLLCWGGVDTNTCGDGDRDSPLQMAIVHPPVAYARSVGVGVDVARERILSVLVMHGAESDPSNTQVPLVFQAINLRHTHSLAYLLNATTVNCEYDGMWAWEYLCQQYIAVFSAFAARHQPLCCCPVDDLVAYDVLCVWPIMVEKCVALLDAQETDMEDTDMFVKYKQAHNQWMARWVQ
jgi:hypothetical protein